MRRKQRDRRKARRRVSMAGKRVVTAKVVAVAVTLVLFLALALIVGDGDYKATVIGWAPFVAVVTAIVLAAVYVRILERGLELTEELSLQDCRRGAEVPFVVCFRNRTPLVFFRIEASFFISDLFGHNAHESVATVALGPFEEYEMGFDARFEHVGTYTAGLHQVVITDFLGLFTRTVLSETHHEVNVTPQLQVLEKITFDDSATVETSKAAKSIIADSMDYSHVREYTQGDPLKTIHWKLSARSDGYLTRLYEVFNEPGLGIFMDFCGHSHDAKVLMGMFDTVVESAFSIGDFARQKGMDTEVIFCNRHGEDRKVLSWNDDTLADIVRELPRMSNDPADEKGLLRLMKSEMFSAHGKSMFVLCSGSMNPEVISALVDAKMQRRSAMMVAVIPPGIDGRARDAYCKPLAQLDAANIPYIVITQSEELAVTLA